MFNQVNCGGIVRLTLKGPTPLAPLAPDPLSSVYAPDSRYMGSTLGGLPPPSVAEYMLSFRGTCFAPIGPFTLMNGPALSHSGWTGSPAEVPPRMGRTRQEPMDGDWNRPSEALYKAGVYRAK